MVAQAMQRCLVLLVILLVPVVPETPLNPVVLVVQFLPGALFVPRIFP